MRAQSRTIRTNATCLEGHLQGSLHLSQCPYLFCSPRLDASKGKLQLRLENGLSSTGSEGFIGLTN